MQHIADGTLHGRNKKTLRSPIAGFARFEFGAVPTIARQEGGRQDPAAKGARAIGKGTTLAQVNLRAEQKSSRLVDFDPDTGKVTPSR